MVSKLVSSELGVFLYRMAAISQNLLSNVGLHLFNFFGGHIHAWEASLISLCWIAYLKQFVQMRCSLFFLTKSYFFLLENRHS